MPHAKDKWNIILICADDLGWTDLGQYGSDFYETPNLDSLAGRGLRFTQAYSAASNCGPARASLLTGRYVPAHGRYTNGSRLRFDGKANTLDWDERKLLAVENVGAIARDLPVITELMQANGYVVGAFGKFHALRPPRGDGTPLIEFLKQRGINTPVVKVDHDHFHPVTAPPTDVLTPSLTKEKLKNTYLSDYMANQAIQFLETNQDKPLFLYLADYLPHVPLEAKEALLQKYQEKPAGDRHYHPVYAAMVESLDQTVGRVLLKIRELGLHRQTIVIFTSDNGGVGANAFAPYGSKGDITDNFPLRGTKGQFYEGGIRIPLIVDWPGVTPSGTVCDEPVHHVDLFPSLIEIASIQQDDLPLDGVSLVPLLRSPDAQLPREDLFWHFPGYLPYRQRPASIIRSGAYKLIENLEDGSLELYNLEEDIGETHNRVHDEPDIASRMHQKLKAWQQASGARIPEVNPDFNPDNEGKW